MSEYRYLDVQQDGFVVTCTMSNPPTHTMVAAEAEELHQLLDALGSDVRVLVLTGGGEDVFVRHYEVGELADASERLQDAPRAAPAGPDRGLRGVILRLEALDAITIAAINGSTMGGGLELALGCDFRLQRQGDYQLGLPETGVGILPGGGGTQRLTRIIGVPAALDLILWGRTFPPEEALHLGIVHRLFPSEGYPEHVHRFAQGLAKRAPRALANAKRAIREGAALPLSAGLDRESALFAELMATEDAALALRAALSGEPMPEFKGR